MIARCQLMLLEAGLGEHLKKHGSKYLALGALGAGALTAHDIASEGGKEAGEAASRFQQAHKKLGVLRGAASELQKKIEQAHEERSEAGKQLLKHPSTQKIAGGLATTGALGAAAIAKKRKEK